LVSGHISRVHAEKLLGPLVIEEAWVSGIEVKHVVSARNATTAVRIRVAGDGHHDLPFPPALSASLPT
jgi:hypothetical protein